MATKPNEDLPLPDQKGVGSVLGTPKATIPLSYTQQEMVQFAADRKSEDSKVTKYTSQLRWLLQCRKISGERRLQPPCALHIITKILADKKYQNAKEFRTPPQVATFEGPEGSDCSGSGVGVEKEDEDELL